MTVWVAMVMKGSERKMSAEVLVNQEVEEEIHKLVMSVWETE